MYERSVQKREFQPKAEELRTKIDLARAELMLHPLSLLFCRMKKFLLL